MRAALCQRLRKWRAERGIPQPDVAHKTPSTLLDDERRLTLEEFERHFGRLPTDGEG